jgi:WXXGXW repeat (2 copies)
MFRTSILTFVGIASLLLLSLRPVYSQAPRDAQDGVEALGRGPVHEAFAQPVDARPEPGPMAPKAPPPAIDEVPPDQKPQGDNVQWIPGYWQWDDEKSEFIWISGFWRQAPPGRVWVPGQYQNTPNGWQWVPGYWSGNSKQAELLPQPPAPVDAAPATPPPSDDSIYVPGVWVYRDARYRWRPAYYLDYRPGWVWQPSQYLWTPNGYAFVDGYWDYPLDQRGLLFAPVAIAPSLLATPNWCYTPNYVVNNDFLPSALFVRPGWQHYYFGDYFGPAYARRGFAPWYGTRYGGQGYDPLYGYSRRAVTDRNWDRDLRSLYAGRHSGDLVLPPRTWSQQQALVRKITVDKTVKVANLKHVTPLTPLSQLDRKAARLQNVTGDDRPLAQHPITAARNAGNVPGPSAPLHIVTPSSPRAASAPTSPGTAAITMHNSGGTPAPRKEALVAPAPKAMKIAAAPAPKAEVHLKAAPAPHHVPTPAHNAPAHSASAHSAPAHGHSSANHRH